jgi:hypothetical protein
MQLMQQRNMFNMAGMDIFNMCFDKYLSHQEEYVNEHTNDAFTEYHC